MTSTPEPSPERWLWLAPLLALGVALPNEIIEFDPAQYAEVARLMVRSGDWIHLADNFGPFLNKPPFTMWLAAACIRVLGPTSVAARLPSFLAAAVLLWTTARIGEELWNRRTGLLAAALLGASVAVQVMVADPKVDMVVTCTMALSVWALLAARRRPWAIWLAWLFAGLGMLTKGPIGLVAPAVAVFPEAIRRLWGQAPPSPPGSVLGRLLAFRPVRGLLLVGLLLLPYYWGVVEQHGEGGPRFLLWEQSFGRVLGRSEYRNAAGALFYLHTALWAFLPLVFLLAWELGRRAVAFAKAPKLPHDEARVVLWWLLLPLLAISLSQYKLPQYLYWLAPPAALLAARGAQTAGEAVRRWLDRVHLALGALGLLACLGLAGWLFPSRGLSGWAWVALPYSAVFAGVWASRSWPGQVRTAALAVLAVCGLDVFYQGYAHRQLTAYEPSAEWGELARQVDPAGKVLPFFGPSNTNSGAYYADRPAIEAQVGELVELVQQKKASVVVTTPDRLPQLTEGGLVAEPLSTLPLFPISRPTKDFLLPSRRAGAVQQQVMVRLSLQPTRP